ncbi:DUF3560 domain-containing protein [Enterobacter mori]|uniref:DUF3560 domain-containing protein n=1 Tax=Enterobacter mori TaxID=539813 RepID=UPI003B83BF20
MTDVSTTTPDEQYGQEYRATYSPDDNKLRLYTQHRLDEETYAKVSAAGYKWAPKQKFFVAPAWTPAREDLALSLAGEIEDEDSTLFERQEARAERFTGYSDKRAAESAQALVQVDALASSIPMGQPILVGHHSERRAQRDQQKIENGMQRAEMLFERAEYWEDRAKASIRHAKYKEQPAVRYRRIKKIKADLRKSEKFIEHSESMLKLWRSDNLDFKMAYSISNFDHVSCCFTLEKYPRPVEKSQYEGPRSVWSALDEAIITPEQARELSIPAHERTIRHHQRWIRHYNNRLVYEQTMLDDQGSVMTRTAEFCVGGKVLSRGEWLPVLRINKSKGEVSSVETPYYSFMDREGATMLLPVDRITDYQAPTETEAGAAAVATKRPPIVNYPGDDFVSMTKAEWSKKHSDYKGVRAVAASETHAAYRYRRVMVPGCKLANVYISDMKTVEIPQK